MGLKKRVSHIEITEPVTESDGSSQMLQHSESQAFKVTQIVRESGEPRVKINSNTNVPQLTSQINPEKQSTTVTTDGLTEEEYGTDDDSE